MSLLVASSCCISKLVYKSSSYFTAQHSTAQHIVLIKRLAQPFLIITQITETDVQTTQHFSAMPQADDNEAYKQHMGCVMKTKPSRPYKTL